MNPKFFRNGIVMLVLVVGTAALLFTWISTSTTPEATGYSKFLDDVAKGQVTKVTQQGTTLTVDVEGTTPDYTVVVPGILTDVYSDMQEAAASRADRPSPPTSSKPPRPPTRRGSGCC